MGAQQKIVYHHEYLTIQDALAASDVIYTIDSACDFTECYGH